MEFKRYYTDTLPFCQAKNRINAAIMHFLYIFQLESNFSLFTETAAGDTFFKNILQFSVEIIIICNINVQKTLYRNRLRLEGGYTFHRGAW